MLPLTLRRRMTGMKTSAIAAILVCACVANKNGKLPEGRAVYQGPHKDFEKLRPTHIAVMKVNAGTRELARRLRKEIYDGLFERNYSCLRLEVVDDHTLEGVLDKQAVGYDATFELTVSGWKPIRGGRYYIASGEAKMVHRHGEVMWICTFTEVPLEATRMAGKIDISRTIKELAALILKDGKDGFPRHPNIPPPE